MTKWRTAIVRDLQSEGVLFVEDGNHGQDRPRSNEFVGEGVAFIRAGDLKNRTIDFDGASKINQTAYERIRKGFGQPLDVLLSHKGTVGRVAMAPASCPQFVCSPQTTYWRSLDHERLDPMYLRYYLESPAFVRQLDARSGESDMAAYVSLTEQRMLAVTLPPPPEQRAIANLLGALDDKLESNRRIADAIGQMLVAEFSAATAGVANESASSSLVVEMGSPFSGDLFSEPGHGRPLIRIRDLRTHAPQIWTTEHRSDEHVISAGDVVVGMDAEFRSTLWMSNPGVLNQRVCRVRPKDGVARAFALLAIRSDLAFFERAKTGTTVIHLNKADIDKFTVPGLSGEEHRKFSEATEPLVSRWVAEGWESSVLTELRDTLLPELLSGRLRLPAAEELVVAAT